MSNHVATITKDEGRCSFSRKALSVFMAVLLAFLMMPMVPAESASAATDTQAWQAAEITYLPAPENGKITVYEGDSVTVDTVTLVDGTVLGIDEYDVYYFNDVNENGKFDATDTIVSNTISDDRAWGGMPTTEGKYLIVTVPAGTFGAAGENWAWSQTWDDHAAKSQAFSVVKSTASLEGAFAYEPVAAGETETFSDTSFKYDGGDITVGFAVAGKQIDLSKVDVVWYDGEADESAGVYTVKSAGDYKAIVTGNGTDYTGQVEIDFTVDPIDLSKDAVSVGVFTGVASTATEGSLFIGGTNPDWILGSFDGVTVNGEALEKANDDDLKAAISADLIAVNNAEPDANVVTDAALGKYDFKLSAKAPSTNTDVIGDVLASAYVVEEEAAFTYNDAPFKDSSASQYDLDGRVFDTSKGQAFDPSLLAATVNGDEEVALTYKVTKDGKEVQSYSEPGKYTVTVDVAVADDYSYAGHESASFTVVSRTLVNPTVFVSVDGKNVEDNGSLGSFTGDAIQPTVVVKEGKKLENTLVEGTDYTVKWTDGKDAAVESIVSYGTYKLTVEYTGEAAADANMTFTVGKAQLLSAKASAEFFALPSDGSAAVPSFIAYNAQKDAFALSADEISVVYYDTKVYDNDTPDDASDDYLGKGDNRIDAADLTEEGTYWADITVLRTAENIEAVNVLGALFDLTETVVFHDVDANAWYADSVYDASGLGYMDGVAEGIFAPERAMTRAEFAQVVYNMATNGLGGTTEPGVTYPTKYTDVPADAWYAKAIEWASRYGIVNGTSETTFEPNGTVTREQIATMLYRYAGNNAQADLTVLDAFVDGAQVSDWAANAMAWAVEEGYMNGKGADDLQPQATATRAEIATLAVRVQPEAL